MIDFAEFVSKPKSLLIAPAGYGKTHTIAECLKHTASHGKQLILTHTHAGIASIKEKIKKSNIPNSCYNVETISSFAQKYVLSFYTGSDLPEQSESTDYYPFILTKAIEFLKVSLIRSIIKTTYSGLFIDEYQDCTVTQHSFISLLSEILPTRILGDYMQGIFGFNGESLVNLQDPNEMGDYSLHAYELVTPQRWLRGNNEALGNDLKEIRKLLINKSKIALNLFPSIEFHLIEEGDIYDYKKYYNKKVAEILSEKNVLLLHPDSTSINPRIKLIKKFNNRITLIESIDDKDFYALSEQADSFTKENSGTFFREIGLKLFNKTGINNWFNNTGLIRKTKPTDKALIEPIAVMMARIDVPLRFGLISDIIKELRKLPEIKCYRRELLKSFCWALEEADAGGISVQEAMNEKRNSVRRFGRKVFGRCIGTTLLTKGLEFDTVVLINAHKFDCPKHLYVAMTRASKRLIIFSNKNTLIPYK